MRRRLPAHCLALLLTLAALAAARGQADPAGTGRDTAHYTADRPVDFVHMRLEMTFTPEGIRARTCDGRVEYTLRPRASSIRTVRLDAADLRILAVELPGRDKPPTYTHDDRVLTIELPKPVAKGEEFKLAVRYRVADPPRGMHFILPSASNPKRPLTVYTQGEALEARYWFPTHDWPNQRWTSDVVVTVPAPLTVVSPGTLQSRKASADGKAVTFHWRNDIPTAPHHVGIAVGEFTELKDTWNGKPVRVFAPPGQVEAARYTFHKVPEIISLYSKLTGVDFPYPGYTHVVVTDHHHGGMEHAGMSFVAPRNLTAGEDDQIPLEFTESIYVSHMLAHQWFGGIVNYRSVSHAWLNEGFAILLDSTWTGHTDSPDRFPCKMWETAQRIAAFDRSETGQPLVVRYLKEPDDVFLVDGSKIYYKGAWVLDMLRHQLGEEVFWRGVAKYLNDNRWRGVETADLRRALEDVSGRDLEQFFQQWVYGKGVPRLGVDYAWDVAKKQAKVTVRQTQKTDSTTPAFSFPLELVFRSGGTPQPKTVQVTDARHEFTFDFPDEPDLFCVDPKGGVLKTLEVSAPHALMVRQVRQGPTALTRLMAAEALAKPAGPEAVAALQEALADEKEFWMVRRAAATSLSRLNTVASRQALVAAEAKGITNPRALAGLLEALGNLTSSAEAHAAALKYADGHPSLDVQTAAVGALGHLHATPELVTRSVELLQKAAQKPTRRAVRQAAFRAIEALEDPRPLEAVVKLAQPGGDDELRDLAIAAVGRLGRRDAVRDRAREMLTAWLDDPDDSAQRAAAAGLGALGDPRSVTHLERVRASGRPEEVRTAARLAIETIRRPEDPKQATAAMLERLGAIEKQNQELEARLKELLQKLDAQKGPPAKGDKAGKKE
jgi:aminopeptidase N